MIAHAGGTDESLAIVMLFAAIWTGWIGWTRLHDNGFPRVPIAGAYGLLAIAAVLVVTSAFVPRALLGPKTSKTATRPASTATIAFLLRLPLASETGFATVRRSRGSSRTSRACGRLCNVAADAKLFVAIS